MYHILAKNKEEFDEIKKQYDEFSSNFELSGMPDLIVRKAPGFLEKTTLDVSPVNNLGEVTGVSKFSSNPNFNITIAETGKWFINGEDCDYLVNSKVQENITF